MFRTCPKKAPTRKTTCPMAGANFRNAGYSHMIEDNLDQKNPIKAENIHPVAFGSIIFSPAQDKMSIYSAKQLATYMEFLEIAHILWETLRPTSVLTDNK